MSQRRARRLRKRPDDDRAWHDAQMARGSLGPRGYVSWDQVHYQAIVSMTDPKQPGGKAPDHGALLREGRRLYRELLAQQIMEELRK